jgi:hypothetical protein
MNEDNISPIKTGKGCRKRTNNTKYFNEIDDELEDMVRYSNVHMLLCTPMTNYK